MSFLGQGADARIPADTDPFGTPPGSAEYMAEPAFRPPSVVSPRSGEVDTLATLSVVFAFVFAPAGVILGHLALSQIKHRSQLGRRRAVLGLTLSYALIVLAVVALVVWLLLGAGRHNDAASTTDSPTPGVGSSVSSIVIVPPAQGRPRVSVASLRVGDCVEIQKNEPDPTRRAADKVYIYRAHCEVGDGIFLVRQIASNAEQCPPGEYLADEQETIFACFVQYGQ